MQKCKRLRETTMYAMELMHFKNFRLSGWSEKEVKARAP